MSANLRARRARRARRAFGASTTRSIRSRAGKNCASTGSFYCSIASIPVETRRARRRAIAARRGDVGKLTGASNAPRRNRRSRRSSVREDSAAALDGRDDDRAPTTDDGRPRTDDDERAPTTATLEALRHLVRAAKEDSAILDAPSLEFFRRWLEEDLRATIPAPRRDDDGRRRGGRDRDRGRRGDGGRER